MSGNNAAVPEPTGRQRTAILVTLGALSAFGPLSMDLYLPSLPSLGRSLGASDSLAQLTMSVCMVGRGRPTLRRAAQ